MARYAANRVLAAVPVLWAACTLSFLLIRAAPGDPVDIMFGPGPGSSGQAAVTERQKAARRHELGIDRPWPAQYAQWLGRLAHGDLGISFKSRRSVFVELAERVPATAALAAAALAVKLLVAGGLGVLAAAAAGTLWDHATRVLGIVLVAVPGFWLGLLLLWLFAVQLRWLTVAGPPSPARLVLPALTLGLVTAPTTMRVLRASILEEMGHPHVAYARAKGLSERAVLGRHVLRPALLPAVTLLGMSLTYLLAGSVIIETVFSWPGVGKYVMDSILARDYPVVQGFMLFATTATILGNLAVDLVCAALDPRIRLGSRPSG